MNNTNFECFTCFIQTDGFGFCFGFVRKSNTSSSSSANELSFVLYKYFQSCAVDPGRKHIFTDAINSFNEEQQLRRCSSKERTYYLGTNKSARYVENLKVRKRTKQIETDISSAKKVDIVKMEQHVQYMLDHMSQL